GNYVVKPALEARLCGQEIRVDKLDVRQPQQRSVCVGDTDLSECAVDSDERRVAAMKSQRQQIGSVGATKFEHAIVLPGTARTAVKHRGECQSLWCSPFDRSRPVRKLVVRIEVGHHTQSQGRVS